MKTLTHIKIIFIISILFLSSCKENTIGPPEDFNKMPPLSDSIPYDILGSGKICFDRIGPFDNSYSGVVVIDIDNKKNWNIPMLEDAPCISPDGTKFTYTTYTDLNSAWDVYTRNIDGSNLFQISGHKGQERCPTFSNNGQSIIYYSDSFVQGKYVPVFRYDFLTNISTEIMDFGKINFPTIYSPVDQINISSKNKCIVSCFLGLCTFNVNGSNFKTLVKRSDNSYYCSPTWNPNGDKIAAISIKEESVSSENIITQQMSIIIFNEEGKDSTMIYSAQEVYDWSTWNGHNNISICWSPDGTKLLFNKREGYLTSHIYVINSDGSGLNKVTSSPGTTNRSISWGR